MARPPKPYAVLVTENKSHRTKAELEARKNGESALLTGTALKEWPDTKADKDAHNEFLRVRKLLQKIQKDDALYEAVINRYCLIISECKQYETFRDSFFKDSEMIEELWQNKEIEAADYLNQKKSLQNNLLALDRQLMEKRKMLLSIERENIMTILGALRAVPRTPDKSQEKSKMAAFLERRAK